VHPGEALTSATFARRDSNHFGWLVTVDLHRFDSLDEIYSIPSMLVPAAPAPEDWIKANVEQPVVMGPNAEKNQIPGDKPRACCAVFKVWNRRVSAFHA